MGMVYGIWQWDYWPSCHTNLHQKAFSHTSFRFFNAQYVNRPRVGVLNQILIYPPDNLSPIICHAHVGRASLVDVVHRACGAHRAVPRQWLSQPGWRARFVGRSWNAQKKRQIPFDSWWCADSKNVIFIKIGRWPFSKIALLCPTRYFFR